jgi:hypothetical protein
VVVAARAARGVAVHLIIIPWKSAAAADGRRQVVMRGGVVVVGGP